MLHPLDRQLATSARRAHVVRRTPRRPALESLERRDLLSADFTNAIGLGSSNMSAKAVATDLAGNLFVTGTFAGTVDFDPGPGTANLTSDGPDRDIFVAKYDAAGHLAWARRAGSNGSDEGRGVAVDGQGNVYSTGVFSGTVNFDPNGSHNLSAPGGQADPFVWKLDPNGNFVYAHSPLGTAGTLNIGEAIAVDSTGAAYVTGSFQQTLSFNTTPITSLVAVGNTDAWVAKFDPAGNFAWAKSFRGSAGAIDGGDGIAVDGNGNVYTVGTFAGSADFDPGAGTSTLTSAGSQDGFLSKLDTNGNFVLARRVGGSDFDEARAVAVDGNQNIYFTGIYTGTANFGGQTLNRPAGQAGAFAAKYNAQGNIVFVRDFGVTTQGVSAGKGGIGLDGKGNIYVAGAYQGTSTIGPVTLGGFGDQDVFVARLNPAGAIVDAGRLGSPGVDLNNGLAVNGAGRISVAGAFAGNPATIGNFSVPSRGAGNLYAAQLTLVPAPVVSKAPADFDGDGKTDVSVFRPGTAQWLILQSTAGPRATAFGAAVNDMPVPADYDGDGKADFAVFRPSTAQWFILLSAGGSRVVSFGAVNLDVPVVGDYDGDGKADLAVFRPNTAQWFISLSSGGGRATTFGAANLDKPIPGDYDGDGKTDLAVFRPTTAQWFIQQSTAGPRAVAFGGVGLDTPIPADYDGDGKTDLAVYRSSTSQFLILQSTAGGKAVTFGGANIDVPLTGDFDGDGKADIAVFRPGTAQWFLQQSTAGPRAVAFGGVGLDVPIPSPLAYRYTGSLGARGRSVHQLSIPVAPTPEAVAPQDLTLGSGLKRKF